MKNSLIICCILILGGCSSNNNARLEGDTPAENIDTISSTLKNEEHLDTKKGKLDINDTCQNCEGYMAPLGYSSNGKFKAYEYGTSACGRGFHIYDSENNLVKESGYYSCVEDKNQLKWFNNKIYYYDDCQKGVILPKTLPKLKEQQMYVQKYYWTNGKDSIANEFTVAGVE